MDLKAGYKLTAVGIIPNDWEVRKLGEFLEFKNGLNKGKEFFGYGNPIINYTDVYHNSGIYESDVKGKVSLSSDEIRRFQVKAGDVFFTRTSETPEEVGLSAVLLEDINNCSFSGFVLRGRPKNNMLVKEYCAYCFLSKDFREKVINSCTYTTRALTNGRVLSNIDIPVPPIQEQINIAKAFQDVDIIISSLESHISKKKQIKEGTMQLLLTGKKRLSGFVEEWKDRKISEIIIENGSMLTSSSYVDGDIPVIAGGKTPAGFHNVANRKENVITISGSGAYAGYVAYHNYPIFASDCSTISEQKGFDIPFLFYSLLLKQKDIYMCQAGGAQPHIHAKDIKDIVLSIPCDENEQKAISSILSDMDEEIKAIETERDKYLLIKKGMMQDLLTGKTRLK